MPSRPPACGPMTTGCQLAGLLVAPHRSTTDALTKDARAARAGVGGQRRPPTVGPSRFPGEAVARARGHSRRRRVLRRGGGSTASPPHSPAANPAGRLPPSAPATSSSLSLVSRPVPSPPSFSTSSLTAWERACGCGPGRQEGGDRAVGGCWGVVGPCLARVLGGGRVGPSRRCSAALSRPGVVAWPHSTTHAAALRTTTSPVRLWSLVKQPPRQRPWLPGLLLGLVRGAPRVCCAPIKRRGGGGGGAAGVARACT